MKKSGKVILTAAVMGTLLVSGCNDKNTQDGAMKKRNKKTIMINEPVCIYGPPEMLEAQYGGTVPPELLEATDDPPEKPEIIEEVQQDE